MVKGRFGRTLSDQWLEGRFGRESKKDDMNDEKTEDVNKELDDKNGNEMMMDQWLKGRFGREMDQWLKGRFGRDAKENKEDKTVKDHKIEKNFRKSAKKE